MPYRLSCPTCGKSIYVTHDDAGLAVFCRACGVKIVIPPGLGAPGEAQPVSEPIDPFSQSVGEQPALPPPADESRPAPVIIRRPAPAAASTAPERPSGK